MFRNTILASIAIVTTLFLIVIGIPSHVLGQTSQSISQKNTANQKSNIVTGGANSGVTNSGNNAAVQSNANSGGNAEVH